MVSASEKTSLKADRVLLMMADQHIRVAVVGWQCGRRKSTFIGTLISGGALDGGHGSAPTCVTKHKHELETGRTSTFGTHMVCLDANAQPLLVMKATKHKNNNNNKNNTEEGDLVQKATRIVSFMDLAGPHERYLKTTVAGISRGMADYALLLVNAMHPPNHPNHMTIHHLKLCVAMNIPAIIVLTKVDRVVTTSSEVFQNTKRQLHKMLRSDDIGLRPFWVKNASMDIDTVVGKVVNMVLTPVIPVSCVTGEGLDLVRKLLLVLPQRRHHAKNQRNNKPFESSVEEIYQVPGVGTVLSGFVTRGEWRKGEALYIGPLKEDGNTFRTTPKSVHVAQTNVDQNWAGHFVCFAIPKPSRQVRSLFTKHMVAKKDPIGLFQIFQAEVIFINGKTLTITKDQAVITAHILHNKQQVRVVVGIHDSTNKWGEGSVDTIRQGAFARVTFEFMKRHRPQYVRPDMQMTLRDGHVRGYCVVVKVGT